MNRLAILIIFAIPLIPLSGINAKEKSNWQMDADFRFFKYTSGLPNEIGYNPVFQRWESINQNSAQCSGKYFS